VDNLLDDIIRCVLRASSCFCLSEAVYDLFELIEAWLSFPNRNEL